MNPKKHCYFRHIAIELDTYLSAVMQFVQFFVRCIPKSYNVLQMVEDQLPILPNISALSIIRISGLFIIYYPKKNELLINRCWGPCRHSFGSTSLVVSNTRTYRLMVRVETRKRDTSVVGACWIRQSQTILQRKSTEYGGSIFQLSPTCAHAGSDRLASLARESSRVYLNSP